MSLNVKQSLKGNLISSSNISGDIAIGTTYTIAGGEGGTPVIITTEKIEGGYRISLTDSVDTEVIDIMDGKDGAKGDPGNPGVYVGSDEAPEEYYIQIDPEGDAVEYIAPPTIAEVGQILSVKSVDENGKPIEWEVVNMPSSSGGSEKWEKITDTTVEADCSEVRITTDMDGNEFNLKKIIILYKAAPVTEEDSEEARGVKIVVDKDNPSPWERYSVIFGTPKKTESASWRDVVLEKVDDFVYAKSYRVSYNNGSMPNALGYVTGLYANWPPPHSTGRFESYDHKIDSIRLRSVWKTIGAGTQIIAYGVRE